MKTILTYIIFTQWIIIMVPVFGHAEEPVYSIQIGAYQKLESAVTMVNHLKNLGHDAFYREEKIKGKGRWYRVYIQKYHSKNEAQKEARAMKKLGLISDYIIKRISEGKQPPVADNANRPDVFFLHVSSFKEKTNAEKKVKQIEGHGYKAFYLSEKVLGEDWYRVYIGEYENEEAARRIGVDLRNRAIISYFKIIKIDKNALVNKETTPTPSKPR
ncbi:MAG: SPOR domain-containing protein [Deltaproteobacteria bacterium]|nr:SPOR domain-containing protein [Deltaproteobacteria bacterium]